MLNTPIIDDKFEEYLSYSYIKELTLNEILISFEKGDYEIYLPPQVKEISKENDEVKITDSIRGSLDICFRSAILRLKITTVLAFLEYHFRKYVEKGGKGIDFIVFIHENLSQIGDTRVERKRILQKWIGLKKKEMEQQTLQNGSELVSIKEKIQWKGSPALFGYIFLELVKKGYIEPPKYGGEWSFARLAKLCFQYFEINNKKGELTTIGNLTKELQDLDKNTLSPFKREKFNIPDLSDLA